MSMSFPAPADRRRLAIAAGAGAALAAAALWAGDGLTDRAAAQGPSAGSGGITLSVGQLRINQRISSAAVRRSNESLGLLDPIRPESGDPSTTLGWRTDDLRDGAVTGSKVADAAIATSKLVDGGVTTAKLGDGSVTEPKIADGAVTTSKVGDGAVTRSKLAPTERVRWVTKTTNAANAVGRSSDPAYSVLRVGPGRYRAAFDFPVTDCSWTVSPTTDSGIPDAFMTRSAIDTFDPNRIFIQTLDSTGADVDSGWTLHLRC